MSQDRGEGRLGLIKEIRSNKMNIMEHAAFWRMTITVKLLAKEDNSIHHSSIREIEIDEIGK